MPLACARTALLALLAALAAPGPAAAGFRGDLRLVGRFSEPVYLTATRAHRDRQFVAERRGRIRVIRRGRVLARPFLDISREVLIASAREDVDQRGLLSMAFAPDYRRSGRFYVFFIDREDRIRVDELRRSRAGPDRAVLRDRRTLLAIDGAGPMHHGGQLAFGPDGLLYVGVGFTSDVDAPQSPASLKGKILRIDPRGDGRPEVWASGLRNPYRFSFDRATGALVVADVGGDRYEEVNLVRRLRSGANFGWSAFEGPARIGGGLAGRHVRPVIAHSHASGWCSVVGGYVVRNRALGALYGRYVYGDVCHGRVYAARIYSRRPRPLRVRLRVRYLVSFGEDARRRLYAIDFGGAVFRIG
jgi:Glucose / Sorbosone dehydrogenase